MGRKIRNPKSEIRKNLDIQISIQRNQLQPLALANPVLDIEHSSLFRISNYVLEI